MIAPHLQSAWPIARFEEIDSTSEEARRRWADGDDTPHWFTAKRQSAGRGRLGRQWSSPDGNLFASCLFPLKAEPGEAALVCFSAGLAVIDAAGACGVDTATLALKWPNDVEASGAKLAGILIETTGTRAGKLGLICGFGVNVAVAPVRDDRKTACLSELPGGQGLDPLRLLSALDAAFRTRLGRLAAEGFEPTRAGWLARAGHMGEQVRLNPPAGEITGRICGLGPDGALLLAQDDGAIREVRAGEVSVVG